MSASRYAPDTTEPAGQWVKDAACRTDPDAMYPTNNSAEIEAAKQICRSCPVIQECAEQALTQREEHGVWGGLSAADRRSVLRTAQRRQLDAAAIADRIDKARRPSRLRPPKPGTLAELVAAHTVPLHGGHLAWAGPGKVFVNGRSYTHKQACYIVDRGHHPDGKVTSDCGITRCVRHLISVGERTQWAASRTGAAA
ncbi:MULTISPECIES: WhiB family transcriptional regulator [Streptomycetaceae]|uniref:WhiB family transcriptional regulator n=1 Tax=Streptomycetaceae TaxID=2062 RepID=UPI00365E1696